MSAKKVTASAARTRRYRAAYEQLAQIAAQLEDGETDLDAVLPLLTQAQAAYEVCRERIEALKIALGDDVPRQSEAATTMQETEDDIETDDIEPDGEDEFF